MPKKALSQIGEEAGRMAAHKTRL